MIKIRHFLLYFLPLSILVSSAILFVFFKQKQLDVELVQKRENTKLSLVKDNIRDFYEPLVYNVDYLASRQIVKDFLAGKLENKAAIEQDLFNIMYASGDYDQMRLLSLGGQELIRVNKTQDSVYIQNESLLQDKAHRDYVKQIQKLDGESTFVGAIDLNVEFKIVERPYKPVVRVGKIVRNELDEPLGLVITNYWMSNYLKRIKSLLNNQSEVLILTSDGNFIFGPDRYPKFSHLVEDDSLSFGDYYPEEWKTVSSTDEGVVMSDSGLFSFTRVSAVMDNRKEEDRMIILSRVNADQLEATYTYAKGISTLALIFVNLLLAWAAYLLAKSRTQLTQKVEEQVQSLKDLEARFQGIFDNTFQFIGLLEPDGTLIEANKTALDFGGFTLEQARGLKFYDAPWWSLSEATKNQLKDAIKKAAKGEFIRYDVAVKGVDEIRTIDFSLRPIFENGEVKYLVPEGRDISEKLELEKQKRESDERFRQLYETIDEGIVYQSAEGVIIEGNASAERVLGITVDQMNGRTSIDPRWKSINEDGSDFPGDTHPAMVALKTGKPVKDVKMGIFHPQKDDYVWIMVSSYPMFKEGEAKPYMVYSTFEDVTKEHLAKRSLESSRARFKLAAEGSSAGLWDWKIKEESVWWSDRYFEMLGYEAQEFTPSVELLGEMLHPDYKDYLFERVNRHFEHKEPYNLEFKLRTKSGKYKWYLGTGQAQFDENGEPTRMVGSIIDIHERKLAEEELRQSELRFKLAAEGSSVGIWDWIDVKKEEVWWSPRFYELLGYKNNEIPSGLKSFGELLHPDDNEALFERINTHLSGSGDYYFEYRLKTKSGKYKWFLGTGQAEFDENGEPVRMVGSILDIDEKKNFEQELERKVEERTKALQEANKELEGFSYSVSHDLRAPLRAVNGFSEILEEDYADKLDEEGKETIKVIRDSAQQMGQLIDDLLQFSRLGRQEMNTVSVDMNKLLKQVIKTEKAAFNFEKHQLQIQELPLAKGDPSLIKQLWANLISNAIKYSSKEESPIVEVGCLQENEKTTYFVKDNGVGFKQEYAEKLFGVFQRLHSEKEFPGTGVGLALAYRIVKRHNGKIWANAEEGKGATFYFTLNN